MKSRMVLIGLVLAASFILAACDLIQKADNATTTTTVAPVSVQTRLNTFVNALNSDRTHIYLNFDTTTAAYLGGSSGGGFWDTTFPQGSPSYSISGIADSNPANVTATLTGPNGSSFQGGLAVTFVLDAVTSGVYLINKIYAGSTTSGTVIVESIHR